VFGEREERVAKNMMYRGSMAMPAVAPPLAGNAGGFRTSDRRAQVQAVPAEEPRRDADESQAKLAPELVTLVTGGSLPSYAAHAVTNGKVRVKVWLLDSSAAAMAALKKAGLEFSGQAARKMVSGVIEVSKLKSLAKLGSVQFVSLDLGQPR
jgi:hypothetical protein